jgi:hypothetical protein
MMQPSRRETGPAVCVQVSASAQHLFRQPHACDCDGYYTTSQFAITPVACVLDRVLGLLNQCMETLPN